MSRKNKTHEDFYGRALCGAKHPKPRLTNVGYEVSCVDCRKAGREMDERIEAAVSEVHESDAK